MANYTGIPYHPKTLEFAMAKIEEASEYLRKIRTSINCDELPGREFETSDDDGDRIDEARRILMLAQDHIKAAGLLDLKREGYEPDLPEGFEP